MAGEMLMRSFNLLRAGGVIMIPLALCSIISLAIIIERLYSLRVSKVMSTDLIDMTTALIETGEIQKASQLCRRSSCPLADIIQAGLEAYGSPKSEIKEAIVDAGRREVPKLERRLGVLETIVGVAPLLGLLGTVAGMIKVFDVIAVQGVGQAGALAGGISVALITTATGLSIAIPTLVAYNYFSSKAEKFVRELEKISSEILHRMPEIGTGMNDSMQVGTLRK
jgi:biopolymer transport protein ExbB